MLGSAARRNRMVAVWIAIIVASAVIAATARSSGRVSERVHTATTTTSTTLARLAIAPATTPATSPTVTTVAPTTTAVATTAPATTTTRPAADVGPIGVDSQPDPSLPAPAPSPTTPPPAGWTTDRYAGLGTWVDVYDWTETYGGGQISTADIDQMAAYGVQTLYIQPVRWDVDTDLMETDRLLPLLNRAHADGLRIVAWYLPDLQDIDRDFRHLSAIANQLPIDGLAIDIESRSVQDVNLRNAQLLALSDRLRQTYPSYALGAIVLPPVVLDQINPNYWPDYPWAGLARDYNIWLPMSYFTFRTGSWRDANAYTAANVSGVRSHLGQPNALVATIGGIGDQTTVDDVNGMAAACQAQSCYGGSVYDYRTTQDPNVWATLRQAFAR